MEKKPCTRVFAREKHQFKKEYPQQKPQKWQHNFCRVSENALLLSDAAPNEICMGQLQVKLTKTIKN